MGGVTFKAGGVHSATSSALASNRGLTRGNDRGGYFSGGPSKKNLSRSARTGVRSVLSPTSLPALEVAGVLGGETECE